MQQSKLTGRLFTLAMVNAFAVAMLYLASASQPSLFG